MASVAIETPTSSPPILLNYVRRDTLRSHSGPRNALGYALTQLYEFGVARDGDLTDQQRQVVDSSTVNMEELVSQPLAVRVARAQRGIEPVFLNGLIGWGNNLQDPEFGVENRGSESVFYLDSVASLQDFVDVYLPALTEIDGMVSDHFRAFEHSTTGSMRFQTLIPGVQIALERNSAAEWETRRHPHSRYTVSLYADNSAAQNAYQASLSNRPSIPLH